MRTLLVTDTDLGFSSSDFEIKGKDAGFVSGGHVRKRTLHGGRQEGVELLEVSNGELSARICPTRGMGIIDAAFRGMRIGWESPVEEIIHPAYVNLLEMGGRGCHYGFNEFINRCGLSWMGAMGDDEVIDNMGNKGTVFLPLHGKIGWTPARKVSVNWGDGEVIITGETAEQLVFGQNFILRSCFTMSGGKNTLEIEDTLINAGASRNEFELLYHVNLGKPFLEGGSRLYSTFDAIMPRDSFAREEMDDPFVYPSPGKGYIEKVFFLQGYPDKDGFSHNLLVNRKEDLSVCVSYNTDQLPYTVLWKYCNAVSDGYVTGLNPCTDFPNSRKSEREEGRVRGIDPGESVQFRLKIECAGNHNAVQEQKKMIEEFKGKQRFIPEYRENAFPL